jgi:hypothetical protein
VTASVAEIVAETEAELGADGIWPLHPRDAADGDDAYMTYGLWAGAAGVLWALADLRRSEIGSPSFDLAGTADRLHAGYLARVDEENPAVPGLWMGEAGILLVADALAPDAARRERLLECVLANAANETLELMWGAPGTMIAARVMLDRTDDERWARAWRESADELWNAWERESGVWKQQLYGHVAPYLGPAHGFAGNVAALADGGSLLDDERRDELARRATATLAEHAVLEDGRANWPPHAGDASLDHRTGIRVQWCHGAPGMVGALALLPPETQLDRLLEAGAELTWEAGPLVKGPGLCHGTAGNGLALLALYRRTGRSDWLDRARAFAVHALEQVERQREHYGIGRFSLWLGDLGPAVYAMQCVHADAALPTLERW